MNVIPAFMAMLLNTQVAIDRINQFLDEEEVPAFVSSLIEDQERTSRENATTPHIGRDETLGIKNGWFRWNEATETSDAVLSKPSPWRFWKRREAKPDKASTLPTNGPDATQVRASENGAATPIPRFELQDINVIFPKGKLTVVTGPTGKHIAYKTDHVQNAYCIV